VLQGRALKYDCRYLRAARVGRKPRLRGLAPAWVRASAALPAAVRLLRRRNQPEELTMAQTEQHARFQPSETVDFVIVGSGAAGGIIAKELSTAGFSVVVLEQGPRLTESQFDHDEFGTFTQSHNCNDPVTQPQTFRATPHDRAKKALSLIYGRLVGGSNAPFTRSPRRWRSTRSSITAGRHASTAVSVYSSCASSARSRRRWRRCYRWRRRRGAARSGRTAMSRAWRRDTTAVPPVLRTSTQRSVCRCSVPGQSCSARTAPRRRGCC